MNTTDMTYEIARRTRSTQNPLTRKQVGMVMDLLIELMTEELATSEGEIRLKQIGIFRVKLAKMPKPIGLHIPVGKSTSDTYLRICFFPASTMRAHLNNH